MRHESDYLIDLQQLASNVRAIQHNERRNNLSKILDLLENEMCLEVEALRDAEEIRQSDEEDYLAR